MTGPVDEPAAAGDDLAELYEQNPSGQLSTRPDGLIVKVNATLLARLGYHRDELTGVRRFTDLLTPGGRIYHETHLAPLLRMQGELTGIALDLRTATGERVPALVSSRVKTGTDGRPVLIRHSILDAADRRTYEQELLRAKRAAEQEHDRLRRLVAGLQLSLLPDALAAPPGLRTAAHYHMASPEQVGGDFYDLFPLPGGRWGFFLGDVSGKGVHAAATTATARYTLRAAAVYDPDPAAVLANLNRVLFQDYASDRHRHRTVVFGILTPTPDGYLATVAGGGHPAPLLLRSDGSVQYQALTGGTLIGIMATAPIATRTLLLGPGDTLLLYTDGLIEARVDEHGGRYGNNSLLDFVAALAPTTAAGLVDALNDLIGTFPSPVDDDVAFMALQAAPRR
ncbi:PP2C family protein-serine/threonine phosphatase [Micromonosporaceae bacterium Da 78-11]